MYAVPRPRSVSLALIALLLTGGAFFPGAEAQVISIGYRDDFTFGWTFPEGDFPGGEAEDPAGDVVFDLEQAEVPVGTAGVAEAIDVVRLRIDEPDAEVLRISVDLAAMDQLRHFTEHGLFGSQLDIGFSLAGRTYLISGGLWYRCGDDGAVCVIGATSEFVYNAVLYQLAMDDMQPLGQLPTRVVTEDARIEILVPRWALPGSGGARAPGLGDAITDVWAAGRAQTFCIGSCFEAVDLLPDEGAIERLHALMLESNGARLRLTDGRTSVASDGPEDRYAPLYPRQLTLDVSDVGTVQVPILVENTGKNKALVVPSAEVVSAHAVKLGVPKSLEVPGGEARRLLVTVNTSSAFAVDDPLVLRVAIASVGTEPAVDMIVAHVRTVPTLSADAPRLYLHTYTIYEPPLAEHGLGMFGYSGGVLNTLESDPLDDGRGAMINYNCICVSNRIFDWQATTGATAPLYLENESTATLHLEIEAPIDGRLMLAPSLFAGETLVATSEVDVSLQRGANAVEVPLYVSEDALVLEPSDAMFVLYLEGRFRPADVLFGEFLALVDAVNPLLKTEGKSWIELPLLDADAAALRGSHVSLDLSRSTDRVQYVNPGRSALWNVTLVNQGDATDTLTFSGTAPDGWRASFAPGKRFKLAPGESVTVGVYAKAPEDAPEGAAAKVVVEVTSAASGAPVATTSLSAVVTQGVGIAEKSYVADNETASRLADRVTTKESPAVGLPILALLGLVVVALRRRSG